MFVLVPLGSILYLLFKHKNKIVRLLCVVYFICVLLVIAKYFDVHPEQEKANHVQQSTAIITHSQNNMTPQILQSKLNPKIELTMQQIKTVKQAYALYHKKYIRYVATERSLTLQEKRYLENFSSVLDLMIIQRVATLNWMFTAGKRGQPYTQYKTNMQVILRQLNQLHPSKRLAFTRKMILEVTKLQQSYFLAWDSAIHNNKPFPYNLKQGSPLAPQVARTNTTLIRLYHRILSTLPALSKTNQQAWYNRLCTLDFI